MSNAENSISKADVTELLTSDETLTVFNDDQSDSIDELHKLLGDTSTSIAEANDSEAMASTEYSSLLVVDEHSVSALEELEELYGVSDEVGADGLDASLGADESTTEETSGTISLIKELEDLFGSTIESADTDLLLQASELSSDENDTGSVSALDELKAFLGDVTYSETEDIEISSMSALEYPVVSHRSVLDELQDLLQSCVSELKAGANNTIGDMPAFTDIEYPSRDELQNLLENILGQLMLFSNSAITTSHIDSASVLDEYKDFMHEAGGIDKTEEITESGSLFVADDSDTVNVNEADEYMVSSFDDVGAVDAISDPIIDELNLLLGNSNAEIFDASLDSDYLTSAISDEMTALDSYMTESSSDTETRDEASVDTASAETVNPGSASASDTLEELEAMLNEISRSSNDETSVSIKLSKEDSSYEDETSSSFAGKKEDNSEPYKKNKTVTMELDVAAINSPIEGVDLSREQDSHNHIPLAGFMTAIVFTVGFYAFWSWLDTGDGINNHSGELQARLTKKTVIQESVSELVSETGSVTVIPAEADSIYGLLEKMEASNNAPMGSYENESLIIKDTGVDVENRYLRSESGPSTDVISVGENKLPQENRMSLSRLGRRIAVAEISIARLQEEKTTTSQKAFIEPAGLVLAKSELSVKHEVIEQDIQKVTAAKAQGKGSNLWSVHLSSYYGKPPSVNELDYLGNAGISYEIKKAIVNGKVWYRVIVDEFPDYEKAREYSDSIRKNVGRKDIWVNKSQ